MRTFVLALFLASAHALRRKNLHGKSKNSARKTSNEAPTIIWDQTPLSELIQQDSKETQQWQMEMEGREMARKTIVPELMPSDFNPKSMQAVVVPAYGLCLLTIGGILCLMYWHRGPFVAVSILLYVGALSTMSVMIRNIYLTYNFGYPQFVTSFHGLCTALTGLAILSYRSATTGQKITVPTPKTFVTGIGPVALFFALALGCSNLSLLHGNAHFYEVMSSMNIPMTFSLGLAMGRPTNLKLLPPLMLVTFAIAVTAFGEIKFSILGAVFVAAGVFFNAFKAQLQNLLLNPNSMSQVFDPVELVFWTSCLTFLILLVWSLIAEGVAPWNNFWNMGTVAAVLISCVNAAILNTSGLYVMKEVGPVAQQIIGQIKGVLACLGAVAAFGEVITMQQVVGYALIIIGAQWYNQTDWQARQDAKEAEAEKTPA